MSIEKILVLSTAHIMQSTDARLTMGYDRDPLFQDLSYDAITYGYLLFVTDGARESSQMSSDLAGILKYAHEQGCTHVRLDCDGDTYNNLPTWSW